MGNPKIELKIDSKKSSITNLTDRFGYLVKINSNNSKVDWTNSEDNRFKYNVYIGGGRGKEGKSAYEIAVKNGFVGTEQEWLEQNINVYEKDSVYEFPNTGRDGVLYIAKDENSLYRWDSQENKYFCVGNDWTVIKCISGGNANNG